jgi:DtxR family Mn-dependent transcriptional regulator
MSFASSPSGSDRATPLSALAVGARATIADVRGQSTARIDRLLAMGVTPGAPVTMLQTFPAYVFSCDQTELAVERDVADLIFVKRVEE